MITEKDARALTEPQFRNLAARAVYKGIVQYFAKKNGKRPVYLPEPPTHLIAVNKNKRKLLKFHGKRRHLVESMDIKLLHTKFISAKTEKALLLELYRIATVLF